MTWGKGKKIFKICTVFNKVTLKYVLHLSGSWDSVDGILLRLLACSLISDHYLERNVPAPQESKKAAATFGVSLCAEF